MVQAIVLFILGVGASFLALSAVCAFINQVFRYETEKTCQINAYFNWVMQKGTDEQKRLARKLRYSRRLQALRALVGYGPLVDP
jgi:hypothetical protein